jgi:DNA-binding NtrC family response regulator
LVLDVSAPVVRAGVDREVLMTHESAAPALDVPAPSLTPNQIVPLLIGSTVGEIERELVLQTLARYEGNRTHAARARGIGAHPAQQDPAIFGRWNRRARA